jgi:O-antigen/teichoic acid export membrane protein
LTNGLSLDKLKKIIFYVLIFFIGRSALFLAPLFLANFLSKGDYGLLETSLASATVWSNFASLGTAGVVPLVLLRRNARATMGGIIAHQLLVVSGAVIFLLAAMSLDWPLAWKLTTLMTGCLVLQSLASTHLKSLGNSNASVLVEAGLLGLMAVAVVVVHYSGYEGAIVFAALTAVLYGLVLVTAYVGILGRQNRAGLTSAWLASIKLGLPLMLGGIVSFLATTSGRLGMGLLALPEQTAEYAVMARAGALPMIAHQLILVASYRNMFAHSDHAVARLVLQIVFFVSVSVLGFFVFSPWLGFVLGPAFVSAFSQHKSAGMLIAAQAVLWSAIALNDFVIARHQLMHRVLRYSVGFLALALGLGWLALAWSGLSIEKFVLVHSCVMLSFYAAQSWIMNLLGLRLVRVWVTTVALYLLLALIGVGISTVY